MNKLYHQLQKKQCEKTHDTYSGTTKKKNTNKSYTYQATSNEKFDSDFLYEKLEEFSPCKKIPLLYDLIYCSLQLSYLTFNPFLYDKNIVEIFAKAKDGKHVVRYHEDYFEEVPYFNFNNKFIKQYCYNVDENKTYDTLTFLKLVNQTKDHIRDAQNKYNEYHRIFINRM